MINEEESKHRELRRQQIIERAASAADAIIVDSCESQEELEYVTAAVAMKILNHIIWAINSKLLSADLGLPRIR